ncbi:MAG: hypothetical protein ACXVYI_10565 [Mycobacterium sp.]
MNQPSGSQSPTPITLAIYRDLRVGMVVILLMLAAAIVIEQLWATCWQIALSAYYYTSAHSILIAALLALGTLFIVYRGSSDTEDVLLTLAGVSALMIAMVPQGRPDKLCGRDDLPSQYEPAIQPNVWAVVIALSLGWLLMLGQYLRTSTRRKKSLGGVVSLCIFWLIMALGLIALIFWPDKFIEYAHGTAGVLMLSAFIATTFCTAYLARREEESKAPHRRRYTWLYRVIGAVMLVTLIAVITAHLKHPGWELWILVLETTLILEFAAYWVVQTIELWNTPDRRERLPQHAQNRLAKPRTKGFAGLKSELAQAKEEPPGEKLLPLL